MSDTAIILLALQSLEKHCQIIIDLEKDRSHPNIKTAEKILPRVKQLIKQRQNHA